MAPRSHHVEKQGRDVTMKQIENIPFLKKTSSTFKKKKKKKKQHEKKQD